MATTTQQAEPSPEQYQQNPDSPIDALELLRRGNRRFVEGKLLQPNRDPGRLQDVSTGQKPFAAFLSCADSRVPIEIVFDQGFGDIFVTRVAGNIVTTEICGSLEFGCAILGCKLLYVLGHSSCGAVTATHKGQPVPGVISSLYYHISEACLRSEGDIDEAIAENVRLQVQQLIVSPVLAALVQEGKLLIVGGVYDLATGKVTEIDTTRKARRAPSTRNLLKKPGQLTSSLGGLSSSNQITRDHHPLPALKEEAPAPAAAKSSQKPVSSPAPVVEQTTQGSVPFTSSPYLLPAIGALLLVGAFFLYNKRQNDK